MGGERATGPHVLQRLVLEPSCDSPAAARLLWPRLSRLGTGELVEALSEVLSAHAPSQGVLRIDRLELDVGPVRESHLEQDLLEATCRALHEALAELRASASQERMSRREGAGDLVRGSSLGGRDEGSHPSRVTLQEQLSEEERQRECLRFLLLTGRLPWWAGDSEARELETVWRSFSSTAPAEARQVIVTTGRYATVRRRLVLQLGEPSLRELIWLLEQGHAPFILSYVDELEHEQAEERFLPATVADFRVARWELVLGYLLAERGSRFNTKMFVRSTIEGMAQRYSVKYESVLAHLRSALPAARFTPSGRVLSTLLDELWQEGAASQEVDPEQPWGAGPSAATGEAELGRAPAEQGAAFEANLAFVEAMLAQGLPEGRQGPSGLGFDETFQRVARSAVRLRWVVLGHWHRPRVRQRLAERPEPLLEELVRVVLPDHALEVIGYSRHLKQAHEQRPLVRGDAQSFKRTRWRFLLECLVLQQGSTFNTRVFIRATLERLAAHHNLQYAQLLTWVWSELAPLRAATPRTHPLVSHVGALYLALRREQRRRGEAAGSTAQAARLWEVPGQALGGALAGEGGGGTEGEAALVLARLGAASGASLKALSARPREVRALLERVSRLPPARARVFLRAMARSSDAAEWMEREVDSGLLRQSVRALIAPSTQALVSAVLTFVEGLGEGAPGMAALPSETWRRRVRGAALALLVADARLELTPRELLVKVLQRVASSGRLSWEQVLTRATRRRRRLGSALAVVQGWADELVRAKAGSRGLQQRISVEEAVRAFEQRVLSSGTSRTAAAAGRSVSAVLERVERDTSQAVRWRLAMKLRDEATRRRVLRELGDAAVLRVWKWLHPEQFPGVTAALEALRPVLGLSQLSEGVRRGLREVFWRFIWREGPGRVQGHATLLRLFFASLARREPRILAALSVVPAGAALLGGPKGSTERPRPASRAPEHPAARDRASAQRAERPFLEDEAERSFPTRTAGLVLLGPFLNPYFQRLGLLSDAQEFKGPEAQERAVGLVQFLATGHTSFAEPDLILSKVLCGLKPEAPVPIHLELDEATRKLSEGLLSAVIQRWPKSGVKSLQGLRGSYLCRVGQLISGEESWTLHVEPMTYDVLLDSCPWQFSTLKLRWMPRVLFVDWRK